MVGFLRRHATTSGWTTFSTGYCSSEIQDGVQDGIIFFMVFHAQVFLCFWLKRQFIKRMLVVPIF